MFLTILKVICLILVLTGGLNNVKCESIQVNVIWDCNDSKISSFNQIEQQINVEKKIYFKHLIPSKANCFKSTIVLMFETMQNDDAKALLLMLVNEPICEFAEKLSNLYSKFVFAWNCASKVFLPSSNNFIDLSMLSFQNSIDRLRILVERFKWKNTIIVIFNSKNDIFYNTTNPHLISAIKYTFSQVNHQVVSWITMDGQALLEDNSGSIKMITKLIKSKVKCKYIYFSLHL